MEYSFYEKVVNIINNILKKQIIELIKIISVKENLCEDRLLELLDKFNTSV